MADSDSDILEASDDSSFIAEAPVDTSRTRGPYAIQRNGQPFPCAVLVDTSSAKAASPHECHADSAQDDFGATQFWLVGFLTLCWHLTFDTSFRSCQKFLNGVSSRFQSNTSPSGWVDYDIRDASAYEPAQMHIENTSRRAPVSQVIYRLSEASAAYTMFLAGRCTKDFIVVSPSVARCIFGKCWGTLCSLPILLRCNNWPFTSRPNFAAVRRRMSSARSSVETHAERIVSRIHRPTDDTTWMVDPLVYMRFLDCSRFVKAFGMIANAADAIVRALWPSKCRVMMDELMASGFEFPSRASLARARPRLDATYMLLERFEWHLGLFAHEEGANRSIHMTADGSPNSGRDIFGILLDLFVWNRFYHRILPGTSLGHGFMAVVDKMMALLWAVWLCVGPDISNVERFLLDVRSMTSDQGTESNLANVANILKFFADTLGPR